jgi:hypothetical protein
VEQLLDYPMPQNKSNILISKRGLPVSQTVGKNWVYNSVNGHEEIKSQCSRRYNHQRAKCEGQRRSDSGLIVSRSL